MQARTQGEVLGVQTPPEIQEMILNMFLYRKIGI
jgi:hypothetical protein